MKLRIFSLEYIGRPLRNPTVPPATAPKAATRCTTPSPSRPRQWRCWHWGALFSFDSICAKKISQGCEGRYAYDLSVHSRLLQFLTRPAEVRFHRAGARGRCHFLTENTALVTIYFDAPTFSSVKWVRERGICQTELPVDKGPLTWWIILAWFSSLIGVEICFLLRMFLNRIMLRNYGVE